MDPADTSHREPAERKRHPSALAFAFTWSAFVGSLAGLFLLGCFVVGPWLSRVHAIKAPPVRRVTLTTPSPQPAPPPKPERPPSEPKPVVRIRETVSQPREDISSGPTVAEQPQLPTGTSAAPPVLTPPTIPSPQTEPSSNTEQLNRVKVGLFKDRADADALSQRLSDAGFSPMVYSTQRSGRTMYSVQAGAFRDRENADGLVQSLKQSGFEAWVSTDE